MTGDEPNPSQAHLLAHEARYAANSTLDLLAGDRRFTVVSGQEPQRLAAFVHADVVGYCRLIGQDDIGTYTRLIRIRQMLIEPALEQYGGGVVNTAGDSLLIEFSSVISAVRFAAEVQTRIPDFDDGETPDRHIRFRMGVNAGDAIPDGANMHGDSVNIAARLQSVCPPGRVCVSRMVHDHVPDRLGLQFERMGMLDLKNIARPIEAFVMRTDGRAVTRRPSFRRARVAILPFCFALALGGTVGMAVLPRHRIAPITPRSASILVLPFRNVSEDEKQQYLADALTSDLTTDLSRMRDVEVISPRTAFAYRNESVDPKTISRDISVRYLITGTVMRLGQQVKTNIQLIDAASGVQLWGERFENDLADLVKLEDGITCRIAASLDVQLVRAEGHRAEQTVTPDAQDLQLRATSVFFQSVTPENTMTARKLLAEAVRRDPSSAEAWSRLAELTASDYFNHWNGTERAQLDDAEEAVRRALSIDPNLALAHFANGFVQRARGEHQLALAAFDRAIDLNPSFAAAYAQKADELIFTGRPGEAQPLAERAIRLSPRDPSLGIFYWCIGRANFFSEEYDQAISWLRKSIEVRPNLWYNRLYLVSAYALKQDMAAARRTLAEFKRQFPQPVYTLAIVTAYERTNPANDPTVVAARAQFHRGLLLAGMAEN